MKAQVHQLGPITHPFLRLNHHTLLLLQFHFHLFPLLPFPLLPKLIQPPSNNTQEEQGSPFPEVESSHPTTSSIPLPSFPTALIPTVTQTNTTPIKQYSRRARIAQSSALPTIADEPGSPVRDDSQGEACPTDSGFIADQDRAT
nr:hypothetical protein [Tanacetum cinerariifolium]